MAGDGGRWLICACALLVGCSAGNDGTSFSPGTGGQGGGTGALSGASGGGAANNGGATSSPGAGGVGGVTSGGGTAGALGDQSPRSACRAYIDAICRRRAVCSGKSPDEACARFADDFPCPDYFFSAGAAHTPAQMFACAAQVAALSCGIAQSGTPPCSTPGTRAPGEKCLYGSQCASFGCSVSYRGGVCGKCLPTLAPGASCNTQEGVCPVDMPCSAGSCQKPPDIAPVAIPGPGMPCTISCTTGYACSVGQTCAPLPPAGQPCAYLARCSADAYCATGSVCAARPGAGAPCLQDVNGLYQCSASTYCDAPSTVCTVRAPLGAPCTQLASPLSTCVAGAACLETPTKGSYTCRTSREAGESCASPTDACAAGTTCTAGKCVSTGMNAGLYEQVCGP